MELHRIFYISFHPNSFVIKSQFYSILLHLLNGVPLESLYILCTRAENLFFSDNERAWRFPLERRPFHIERFDHSSTKSQRSQLQLSVILCSFIRSSRFSCPPSSEIQTFRIICIVDALYYRVLEEAIKNISSLSLLHKFTLHVPWLFLYFFCREFYAIAIRNVIALVAIKKTVETYCVPYVASFVDKLSIHVFVNNSDEHLILQRMYVTRMIVRYDVKLHVKRKKNQYFFSIYEYICSDNSSILIDTLSNVYISQ